MILLDTDHVSVVRYNAGPRHARLMDRLSAALAVEEVATTIITVEEQFRGWRARLSAERSPEKQVVWYGRLAGLLGFFQSWRVESFDAAAAADFTRLRSQRIRICTQDLKIASIARSRDALLLSANRRDFSRVPGLRAEDWMSPS